LIDLHELLIPVLDVGRLLARVGVVVLGWSGVVLVVFAPLEDLAEDGLADLEEGEEGGVSDVRRVREVGVGWNECEETYIHDGNWLLAWSAQVLDHVLDQHAALGNLALCGSCQLEGGWVMDERGTYE
jgi:hypothetical protein